MSNALEQASLIMVPSGYEDGRLGSLKPLDGSGDFTFARCNGAAQCDLAATRVNADGYIEKGYENLLLQSNSFTTSPWTSNTNETSGQAGYDGSNDAWKLSAISGNSSRIIQTFSISGLITVSIYAKSAEWDYVGLYTAGSNKGVVWSLIDGTPQNPIVAYPDIYGNGESIGNGWWRFSITHNAIAGEYRIYPCEQNIYNGNNPDGVKGIYIQDAMLNQGMVAYPYLETTTAPVAGGILEDMPRLDYSNGSCPSLLLEPSRTNLVTNSEYGFVTGNTSIDYNNAISPEGYQNAFKSTATTTSGVFTRVADISGGVTNPLVSVFVKYGNNPWLNIIYSGSADTYFNFNCQTGEFGTSVGSLTSNLKAEDYGNGWWRVSARFNYSGAGSLRVYMASSGTTGFANGSTTIGNYFYGYGFQLEQDATYPTSYIPTYGVSQTRLGEGRVNRLSSPITFGAGEDFTLFFDGEFNNPIFSEMIMGGRTTSISYWWIQNYQSGKITSHLGNEMANWTYMNLSINTRYKMLVKRDSNVIKFFLNGVALTTNQSAGVSDPFTFQSLGYGFNDIGSYSFSGKLNQALVFPTALSDEACIELTTIS